MVSYRKLGRSGLEVSEIGLGCWAIGGLFYDYDGNSNGWTSNNDEESSAGLYKAYELGINHWDTADAYGKGHSERLIGKSFKSSVKRDEIILATKIGWFKGTADHSFDPLHVRHQLEQSLQNLRTDYVDIYYFHNPFFGENDEYLIPAAEEVHRMRDEGKIRVIGQSAYSYEQFLHVCPVTKPDVLQLPYNAINSPFDTEDTDIFKWAETQDLGIVMFGTYAKGLLLGKYNPQNPPQFGRGDYRKNDDLFREDFLQKFQSALDELCSRFGNDPQKLAKIANQYALAKSKNAVVIPGYTRVDQVISNFNTMGLPISDDEYRFVTETFAAFKI